MSENDQTVLLNEYTLNIDINSDSTVTYAEMLDRIYAIWQREYGKYDNGILIEP